VADDALFASRTNLRDEGPAFAFVARIQRPDLASGRPPFAVCASAVFWRKAGAFASSEVWA